MLQNATPLRFSGNQRPDLLTALMNMSLVLRLPRNTHLCRSSSHVPRLPSFLEMLQNTLFAHFWQGAQSRLPHETTSKRQKVVRACSVFNMFTSKCASRHNSVHFFDISTSKSAPRLQCFVHFDLGNVLRATTACNFSSLIWPAGSAPAALASLLFDPAEPQIIGKTECFATFLPFRAPGSYFFRDFLFLIFFLLLFSSLLWLCPSLLFSVNIVWSLTSKLPSIMCVCACVILCNLNVNIYIYIYIDVRGRCRTMGNYRFRYRLQTRAVPVLKYRGEVSAWKVHMIPADQINMQCVDKPNFVCWFITPWIL